MIVVYVVLGLAVVGAVTSPDAPAAPADADRDARRIVRQHAGQIRRDAATLERTGQL